MFHKCISVTGTSIIRVRRWLFPPWNYTSRLLYWSLIGPQTITYHFFLPTVSTFSLEAFWYCHICVPARLPVNQSWVCPQDNSSHVKDRITKFESEVQITVVPDLTSFERCLISDSHKFVSCRTTHLQIYTNDVLMPILKGVDTVVISTIDWSNVKSYD